jgi:single-strand selective monofunctional uracil DNA glycosylase
MPSAICKLDARLRSRQITSMSNENFPDLLIEAARELSEKVDRLKFKRPVTHVYNPLNYAWAAHEEFLRRFGNSTKKIIFLGMNPGPFGMVQTGVPFGEISAVRDWLRIAAKIGNPAKQHTKRPIFGYECERSEVSGQRLWGLFQKRFGSPEKFFRDHFVVNYCPLAFLEESGCNRTPDKLPKVEAARLFKICDEHLNRVVEILKPEWLVGIGGFALARAKLAGEKNSVRVGQILHPSPASPAANRGWAEAATKQLVELGVWKSA